MGFYVPLPPAEILIPINDLRVMTEHHFAEKSVSPQKRAKTPKSVHPYPEGTRFVS